MSTISPDQEALFQRAIDLVGFAVANHLMQRAIVGDSTWPVLNAPLLHKVLDHIVAHPDEHDQSLWATRRFDQDGNVCGTRYCFAGHTVVMGMGQGEQLIWHPQTWREIPYQDELQVASSGAVDLNSADGRIRLIASRAQELLGLTLQESERLFFATNRVDQIAHMIEVMELAEQHRLARIETAEGKAR